MRPLTKGRKAILAALTLLVIFGAVGLSGALSNFNISAQTAQPTSINELPGTLGAGATPVAGTTGRATDATPAGSAAATSPAIYPTGTLGSATSGTPLAAAPATAAGDKKVADNIAALEQTATKFEQAARDADAAYQAAEKANPGSRNANDLRNAAIATNAVAQDARAAVDDAIAAAKPDYCSEHKPNKYIPTVKSAICEVLVDIGDWVSRTASDLTQNFITRINTGMENRDFSFGDWVERGWNASRTLVDIMAVIALILVGFANILHINLNVYAVKRMLPRLIMALIAANLSLFLIRGVSSIGFEIAKAIGTDAAAGIGTLTNTISQLFTELLMKATFGGATAAGGAAAAGLATIVVGPGGVVAALIFLLIFLTCFVIVLILAFLLFIQPILVSVLTIAAPLAIVCMAIPPTEKVFGKWLAMTFNWIFMFPATLLLLALMNIIAPKVTDNVLVHLAVIVADGLILLFAVRLPFSMGGDIAAAWGKAGKWAAAQPGTGAKYFAAGYRPDPSLKGDKVNSLRGKMLNILPFVDTKLLKKGFATRAERGENKAYGKADTLSWGYKKIIGPEGVLMSEGESKRNEVRDNFMTAGEREEKIRKILTDDFKIDPGRLTDDQEKQIYALAKTKLVKIWDGYWGSLDGHLRNKAESFSDLWAFLNTLRQDAQGMGPRAVEARRALRSMSLHDIMGKGYELGANEEDYRTKLGIRRRDEGAELGLSSGEEAVVEQNEDVGSISVFEGREGAELNQDADDMLNGKGRVDELHVENLLVQNAEVSELGQLTTMADKVESSRDDLAGALKGANIGIDDTKLNDLVMAIQTYSEANTMRVRGLWWQSQLATPILTRLSTTLRKLGFTNQDEVAALEGLGSQSGSLSADDALRLAKVDPAGVSAEQKQPIEAALNRHQRAGQIRDLSYEYHAVKNIEGQTGIEFPEMISEVAEIGRVVKQPGDLNRMTGLVNEGIQRIDSPEATSIQGINKIRQETLSRAMPQRLAVTQDTDPLALKERVKKELTSANAALRLASSNQAILEVAQKPGANLAQIEGAIRTSLGQAYAQQRQPRVAANQAAMAAERKAVLPPSTPADATNRTLPPVTPPPAAPQ